ncbi:MAG: disulfide reductase [Deltaproteobacteria bacterium]|nr:disulfide reductase [Deltaproteobacteria bacterium]
MQVSYYPGCTLEGTAVDYAASIAAVAPLLEVELIELEDWNCCGASAAHSINHTLALELPVRNVLIAWEAGRDLVVPCALCFNRLKVAEKALAGPEGRKWGPPPPRPLKIWDLLDYFSQPALLQTLKDKVVRPLTGLRAVCYYGCLAARPPKVTDKEDYEDPQNMEAILQVLGAEPVDWSFKTDCCGAGLTVARPDLIEALVQRLYDRALAAEAECFVVSCQMCQANLDLPQRRIAKKTGRPYYLPVLYFTELMGLALGHPDVSNWLGKHLTDPRPLLQSKNLL